MSKLRRSLSKRLSLDIMLLAIPVFVLSLGIFYLQSRYLIRQEAIERSNSILKTTVQRVNNYMSTVETSINANAWLLEENFRPDSLEAVSRRIVRLNPHILSCSVSAEPDLFPQYGRYFSVYTVNEKLREGDDTSAMKGSIISVRETDYEYTDKLWYKEPLRLGKPCWVEPFGEYTQGKIDHNDAVATYCRPLSSEKGDILGVVTADFSFSQLAKSVTDTEHPYPDAYFMLLGSDGRYFIHPDTTCLFRKTIYTDANPNQHADMIALGHEMTEGKLGTMHVNVNGRRCHVCYHPVPGTDWSLAMVCPDSEILVGYHRLAYVITIIIFLGLLTMLWLCNKVVRQTVHLINQLLSHTRQIADGNYDEAIPYTDQKDDIGALQNGFIKMQQALHDHLGRIHQTAEEIRKHNEERARDMELAEEAVKKTTTFIQNLSHQIRTPLNIIMGFANVIHENIVSRSKGADALDPFHDINVGKITDMMKHNTIQLKRMILMLFDSSSTVDELMGNRTDEVSCNEVVRESIDYTLGHFQKLDVKFESELSDATHILTSHIYLTRTLRELLDNAANYSDGKHITLQVSQTETTVNFTITDVGPGLPENAEELIFKPFIKFDDMSEGLGLGLPLCKRHALSLGGDLIYDKDYKEGCRFILQMPK